MLAEQNSMHSQSRWCWSNLFGSGFQLDSGPEYKLMYTSSPLLSHRLRSSHGMSLIGSVLQPVRLDWRYIQVLMRDIFSRRELVNVMCSWYGHVSSCHSLEVLSERGKLEKMINREDVRPCAYETLAHQSVLVFLISIHQH